MNIARNKSTLRGSVDEIEVMVETIGDGLNRVIQVTLMSIIRLLTYIYCAEERYRVLHKALHQ